MTKPWAEIKAEAAALAMGMTLEEYAQWDKKRDAELDALELPSYADPDREEPYQSPSGVQRPDWDRD